MFWIIAIIVLAALIFLLMEFMRRRGINHVARTSSEITKKMNTRVEKSQNDAEPYSTWLRESNPEELFLRIMAHTGPNKKLRGELLSKLYGACRFIQETIVVDTHANTAIQFGAIKFTNVFTGEDHNGVDLTELGNQRKNLISTVNQYFGDIKAILQTSTNI